MGNTVEVVFPRAPVEIDEWTIGNGATTEEAIELAILSARRMGKHDGVGRADETIAVFYSFTWLACGGILVRYAWVLQRALDGVSERAALENAAATAYDDQSQVPLAPVIVTSRHAMATPHLSTPTLSLTYVNALDIGKRSRGAAIGLLFYDYLTNLDREASCHLLSLDSKLKHEKPRFNWSGPNLSEIRSSTCIYLFFAFVYYVWDTIPLTSAGTNTSLARRCEYSALACGRFYILAPVISDLTTYKNSTLLATLAVQVILQLRIYALYGRSRVLLVFLLTFCFLEATAMAFLVAFTMAHLRRLPIASTNTGCAYEGLIKVSALFWLPGLVFEPVLFVLVAYKARGSDSRETLISRMARESLVYFTGVFVELLLSTVIWACAPQYINIVNPGGHDEDDEQIIVQQRPAERRTETSATTWQSSGSLTTGNKLNRLAFADAEELQKKVERMRARISSLEDALRALQESVTDDPHPLLLSDETAMDTSGDAAVNTRTPGESIPGPPLTREDEEFLDSFGTLTLGLRGESRFFGQTSRSEYLIHAPRPHSSTPYGCTQSDYPRLSPELFEEATKGFETTSHKPELKRQVLQMLPSLSSACRLCEIFLEHGEYIWYPIPRTQLFDEILSVIYRSFPYNPGNEECCLVSSHAASLLFMVFALASLFDPEQPSNSDAAREYFLLARLCLRFASPQQDTTLWAIQSLIYMVQFMEMSDREPAHSHSHAAWILMGFACKLGHSIGLHVNSSRWQLGEEAGQRRARVFWQLFLQDTWISFGFGRPPCMSLAFVDCEFPKDPEELTDAEGHKEWGFHPWSWQYTKLLHQVMTTAFGAKTPPYSTVLELDRKIRDFPVPWRLRIKCGMNEESEPTKAIFMQRWFVMSCKEATLLNLHRSYFAQALNEMPQDLLRHRYGPSVMAIYRSAWRLIEGLRETHKRVPAVMERLGLPWSQSLSAAIVMCLLVTRAPTSSLAPASLHELDRLCELFEQLESKSQTAANNLEVVQKLRKQAHDASSATESVDRTNPASTELDRIGGKTHLISPGPIGTACSTTSSSPACSPASNNAGSPSNSMTASSSSAVATPPYELIATPASIFVPQDQIHPTIISDMRTFESFGLLDTGNGASISAVQDFNFDLSKAFPLPQEVQPSPDFSGFQDIQNYFGEEFFGPVPTTATSASAAATSLPAFMATPNMGTELNPNVPMPVLDATWQSFVEQLGF
ncbi:hypothetical protein NM688_g5369 [Phlebia brevispora]|uniref:Uncharacterized protein n=1 Tax=Phlebia brevispora TaxID=194682 RepID=A0ACC1SWJ5_9APHY|nr:hypothetical protein NM688_g5369 [Phlebia brevispora]